MESTDVKKPSNSRRCARWFTRKLERALAVIGLTVIVYHTCFDLSRITTESMEPTLFGRSWDEGDRLLTEKVSYYFRSPRRWEVIAIRSEDGRQLVKRVVALPGERIQMLSDGRIMIDGELLTIPARLSFLEYFPFGNLTGGKAFECGSGYYVLGDYSKDSDDSRFNGTVAPGNLIGRAWYVHYPANHRGFVKH